MWAGSSRDIVYSKYILESIVFVMLVFACMIKENGVTFSSKFPSISCEKSPEKYICIFFSQVLCTLQMLKPSNENNLSPCEIDRSFTIIVKLFFTCRNEYFVKNELGTVSEVRACYLTFRMFQGTFIWGSEQFNEQRAAGQLLDSSNRYRSGRTFVQDWHFIAACHYAF